MGHSQKAHSQVGHSSVGSQGRREKNEDVNDRERQSMEVSDDGIVFGDKEMAVSTALKPKEPDEDSIKSANNQTIS